MIGSKKHSIALTDDHKPENPEELARIEKAGGFVADNRVVGELAMSRAIGDFRYKSMPDLPFYEQLVIPVPDIAVHERHLHDDYVLIVACDGVWDTMSNDEAAVFVQEYLEKPTRFSIQDYLTADGPISKRRKLDANDDDDDDDNNVTTSSSSDSSDDGEGGTDADDERAALKTASALISVSLAKGSMDNISAIVVKFPAAETLGKETAKKN